MKLISVDVETFSWGEGPQKQSSFQAEKERHQKEKGAERATERLTQRDMYTHRDRDGETDTERERDRERQ